MKRSYSAGRPAFQNRRNQYAGTCSACGGRVPAGAGYWSRESGVKHAACPVKVTRVPVAAPVTVTVVDPRPRGRFTADYERMANSVATREIGERRLNEMSQGMTMDYIVEFGEESAAIRWALEILDERFGKLDSNN